MIAKGVLYGLAVDAGQRYAFGGFVGGEASQRVVEMIDMYTSASVGYWQYQNENGEYANPRALAVDNNGHLIVGLDGTSDGVKVAIVAYNTATGEMTQKSVTAVLEKPEGIDLLCRSVKYFEMDNNKYVYVLTSDQVMNEQKIEAGVKDYDRIYRYILNDDLSLTLDNTFGVDESGTQNVGFAVVKVAASGNNNGSDHLVDEVYDFDIRTDSEKYGEIWVSVGTAHLNATRITKDGKYHTGQAWDDDGKGGNKWASLGPIAIVEGKYLAVMHNNQSYYTGSQWRNEQMTIFDVNGNLIRENGDSGRCIRWELPYYTAGGEYGSVLSRRNLCGAMCYVGGNLYFVNTGTENVSTDSDGADTDQIWVMSITQEGSQAAGKIVSAVAGRTQDLEAIWAQNNGNILTGEKGNLTHGKNSLSGFAVSADEKYAFLGFTGGEAANRSLEMVNLKTGASLGAYQHTVADTFANPRAADAYKNGSLFVGLDGTSEGVTIAKINYTADGKMTEVWNYSVAEDSSLMVKEVLYRVIGGTEYLYVMTYGSGTAEKDNIYRFTIGEDGLTADGTFGTNGVANPHTLSGDGNEVFGLDVDTDGTIYVSVGWQFVAKLSSDGKDLGGKLWLNGNDNPYGALAIVGDYVITPNVRGNNHRQVMVWNKAYSSRATFTDGLRTSYGEASNSFVHMRVVNGNLYAADCGAGAETSEVDVNADKIWVAKKGVNEIKTVGYQTSEVTDGTYNVRFVGALESNNYTSAGFEITYTYTDADGNEVTYTYSTEDTSCEKAYTSIKGLGATIRAKGLGGEYLIAMTVEGIPVDIGEITFTVRGFVVDADGGRWEENAHTFTVNANA